MPPSLLIPQTYYLVMDLQSWDSLAVEIQNEPGASLSFKDAFGMDFEVLGFGFVPVFKTREAAEAYIKENCGGKAEIVVVASEKYAS